MTEPLGRSQVLEYLIDLSQNNQINLISFERVEDLQSVEEIQSFIAPYNIEWSYLIYSNKYGVFSTIGQIFKVLKIASKIIKQKSIETIHARSMIPATIAMILKKIYGVKLLFDIRGFAIDEKLDSGRLQQNSMLFKLLKALDNYLYRASDHIVTLTYKAKDILIESQNISQSVITVIPTCASREVFKKLNDEESRAFKISLGYREEDKIIIHTGTVSGWYDFDNELKVLKELMLIDENIQFLVLNKNEHTFIDELLKKHKVDMQRVSVSSTSFGDMHKYLSIADASLFFIKPSYSKQASAPTKFAENIACHLPSITNRGVGDMEYYMDRYSVGYLVDLEQLDLPQVSRDIVTMVEENSFDMKVFDELFATHFDKDMAVEKYQAIYELLEKS
jgi:hypothetical protein